MKDLTDIFNFKETKDLPQELIKDLKGMSFTPAVDQVLDLFKIKEELCIDEILVGLFRLHHIMKKRNSLVAFINQLIKRNILCQSGGRRGIYRVTSRG